MARRGKSIFVQNLLYSPLVAEQRPPVAEQRPPVSVATVSRYTGVYMSKIKWPRAVVCRPDGMGVTG